MTLTDLQQRALDVVKVHTKSRPITGVEIAKRIGLKDRDTGKQGADMRSVINALRVKGYPICAHGAGYYWPRSSAELTEYVNSFQARIDDQQHACDGIRAGWDKLDEPVLEPGESPARNFSYRVGDRMFLVHRSRREQFLADHPDAVLDQ